MAVTQSDRSLVASSEFDPNGFIKGIDAMTAALTKLSAQEDQLRADMTATNTTLKSNRTELKATEDQIKSLDKTSATYANDLKTLQDRQAALQASNKAMRDQLADQKTKLGECDAAAKKYKDAIEGLSVISKQVADENKGRTLFDVASLNAQVQEVTEAGARMKDVLTDKIDSKELDKFTEELAACDDEMQELAKTVEFVKQNLDKLDPNSQEFEDLNKIVETGEKVLDAYGKETQKVDTANVSLRKQLRLVREELARMEEAGDDASEKFEELQIRAGELQDQLGDTQQRIRVLSSDTKALDFGIGALRGVISAYGVAEGAATLFGIKNEELAESIQKLNAIMLILNGLQEIQNLLQAQSVVRIIGAQLATKAAAAAQYVYAIAVGTSTGAMKAFRVALLATGIGAFVVLLGLAADAMGLFGSSTEEATDDAKEFTEALEDLVSQLETFNRFNNTMTAVREEQLKRQGASEQTLFNNRIKGLTNEKDATLKAYFAIREAQDRYLNAGGADKEYIEKSNAQATQYFNRVQDLGDQITIEKEKNLTRQYNDQKKAYEKELQLYLAYIDRLTALQRQLRDKLLAAQPQDEARIREGFKNSLADALADLDKDVKQGKLSKARSKVLAGVIGNINDADLAAALKKFNQAQEKAEQELANKIYDLRIKNGQERAELMQDQFTREAAVVAIESRNQGTLLKRERDELIASINETRDQGLISPEAAKANIEKIEDIYAQLLENLAIQTTRKQEEITARTFQAQQAELQRIFANVQLFVSEKATDEIVKLAQLYNSGKISYEKYQKELTRIVQDETTKRLATALREQEALLRAAEERKKVETDPERAKELEDQIRQLRLQISDLKRQLAQADAEGTAQDKADRDERLQKLAGYATAVGNITSQVVQFWAAANQAEQQALERSIALQERRVDAATRIAERGNAEYLRLEEDRLNELQTKQENAARRQLAINAVLQTSQALTAFVTALAQGIATGGPLGGIAIAAAVIGLIASGYAIITNLQKSNTQGFAGGTKSVRRNGAPAGTDTVPAMLTEDEAVIPVDRNRDYRDSVAAIYDRSVPADAMNDFVNSYRVNRRTFPRLNQERMSDASTTRVTFDGQLLEATEKQSRQLEENNQLMRQMTKTLKSMGVNVNVDKDGLAISVMQAVSQHKIDKKA